MLDKVQKAQTVQMPFLLMGIIVVLVALAIFMIKLPEVGGNTEQQRKSVWGRHMFC